MLASVSPKPGSEFDPLAFLAMRGSVVAVSEQIVEVNEAIREARPIAPLAGNEHEQHLQAEKGGSSVTSKRSSRRR